MSAQGAEEEGLFGGGLVACWWVERWCVWRFWGLGRTGEVVARGGDVGSEVLGEKDVAFNDGQGGGFRFLVCIWHEVDLDGVCPEVMHAEKTTTKRRRKYFD